jgi:DNA helicase-2/ATP-dependent DNA helicase PcrA
VRRLEALAADGVEPEHVLILTRSRAGATRLRARAGALVDPPYEELWIATYEAAAERLLTEYALDAGLDPFFATVRLADRLALLLDHLDDLSLRRHEIRGNPAGLLARLLRRIDALKAEGIGPGRLRDWAEERERDSSIVAEKERARREREFADLYASHDRILRENGSLDGGDLVIELERLLRDRPDVRREVSGRFKFVMVDELEDAGMAHRALVDAVAEHQNLVCACDIAQSIRRPPAAAVDPGPSFMERHPEAAQVKLELPLRFGADVARAAGAVADLEMEEASPEGERSDGAESSVRFWRCTTERAEAQATAREIEHLLAAGEVRADVAAP